MKIKYLRLNKEERKEARDKFFATEKGILVKKKLNYGLFCSILLMLFSIYLLIDAIKNKLGTWSIIYGVGVFVFGIVFLIYYFKIRTTVVNNYLTKPNNKKKK